MSDPAEPAHTTEPSPGSFDDLTPHVVTMAVEAFFPFSLDGTVEPYASYVNRVYGLRSDDGEPLVAKFYRPGRWSREAILEEHRFLEDLVGREVPVVAPLADEEGDTLFEVELDPAGPEGDSDGERADSDRGAGPSSGGKAFLFALFPKRGGRSFDAESDQDWLRLGAIVGRMHAAALREEALQRVRVDPRSWTGAYVEELLQSGVVHGGCAAEFEEVARSAVEQILPLFAGMPEHRLHGDCHRGNILDRPGEGLLLIDFDDMMMGPAVQDLWLLLPDHVQEARRELELLLEGYEQFRPFPREQIELIEPLRFMRMIHFLAWRARQRQDYWFREHFPQWGNEAFWIKEIEDLREQSRYF
ncbi:Ser/Thr protein kinase RdoA involved in Cpx stress response, MazF antagonist [Alkalispirochaeta americana]|uniref:Stress response kinase A n=1 Tax=Alkalispirochaeta americana TaxID=159291 RepID=A0A1N6WCR5_9SPIO|nr:serine/threonine protein kinase [Alkalispirochaeta americana]SIQ87939.1 Ser/Thr protein kinase RdoA involved in Cpx stress response, MazF antagonist [Alkalispirochaeta americana]